MDLEGDLAAVFDTAIFGVRASLRAANGGASHQVEGVFDEPSEAVGTAGAIAVELTAPRFMASTASLPAALAEGWILKHGSRSFVVRVIQPDGTGVTALTLQAV